LTPRRGKYGRRDRGATSSQRRSPSRGEKSAAPRTEKRRKGSLNQAIVEGVVSANRGGFGFVRVIGRSEDIFLPPREMRGLMHGDRVRVRINQDASNRWSGEVQEVLDRGVTAFLGIVEQEGRSLWVSAADRRLQLRCTVAPADLAGAKKGDWVIARIRRYASSTTPAQAVIEKLLDPAHAVELGTETAVARFNLPHEFPTAALREAEEYGERIDHREAAARTNLRDMPLVTIDGEDAKDFDDAVYAEAQADGFRLVVAIADVSYYVRPGTSLDTAARERGTSVYFPTRVVPMLPTALSDHLCSLAPKVDRLCYVADMLINRHGALKGVRFYPAVMRSAARLTYTLAYQALFIGAPAARAELGPLFERLRVLVDVYKVLHKARSRRGALDFDAPEARFRFDAAERVTAIDLVERNDAHRLVEECMIMANVAVATELSRTRTPSLYRVHGEPEEQKLERLLAALTALGIGAQIPKTVAPRDLQAITRHLGRSPERPYVESLIIRSMQQALYQPTNIGHFGLALTQYAHFTSPIRRYPDLIVHRTLKTLSGTDRAAMRYDSAELSVLGEGNSTLEKRAAEADRYVSSYLKCTYLRERIGQSFHGLITTVVEFGCFVQILDVAIDGLLHVDRLSDDQYEMEPDGHGWRGRRSGRRLRAGAQLKVVVTAVNPIEALIDLELATE
jgi:ribonuclease R